MKIGICEDEKILRDDIRILVEKYYNERQIACEIYEYQRGEELTATHHNEEIILLDISMAELDGIEAAKKMRTSGSKSIIIFLTSHTERVFEAFKVQAFRYLLKPVAEAELRSALDEAIDTLKQEESKFLTIHIKQNIIKIAPKEILYIESIGKNIDIHTNGEVYTTREKISDLEKILQEENFFRIHKSYLVNLEHVKAVESDEVILCNENIIYVSRLRLKAFKEAFMNYLMKDKKIWN